MGNSESRPPRVFLSYSREPESHGLAVRDFCSFLRDRGIDARMDVDTEEQPRSIPEWSREELAAADYVLCIASPRYCESFGRSDALDTGNGARAEGEYISDAFYQNDHAARRKFLPIVLPNTTADDIPAAFLPASHTYYKIAEFSEHGARNLLRYLRGSETTASVRVDLAIQGDPDAIDTLLPALRELGNEPAHRREGLIGHFDGAEALVAQLAGAMLRRLREVSDERRIMARVGVTVADEQTSTLELAGCDALRALLKVPDARVVVAISPGVRELLAGTSASYPPGSSFRRIEEPPAWIAVLGRRVCPSPPSTPAAREKPRGPSASVSFSGTNHGIVAAAGRDVVVGNVRHGAWR